MDALTLDLIRMFTAVVDEDSRTPNVRRNVATKCAGVIGNGNARLLQESNPSLEPAERNVWTNSVFLTSRAMIIAVFSVRIGRRQVSS